MENHYSEDKHAQLIETIINKIMLKQLLTQYEKLIDCKRCTLNDTEQHNTYNIQFNFSIAIKQLDTRVRSTIMKQGLPTLFSIQAHPLFFALKKKKQKNSYLIF